MAPFVMAALPALVQAAPSLIRLFGSGEQSDKNAATAEAVAHIAKQITAEPTVEGAVAALQAAPEKAKAFSEAVESNWFALTGEAGSGGIAGARKADAEARDRPLLSPAMLVTLLLVPMAYIVVVAVLFMEGWSEEIRAMVVSSVLSLIVSGVTGYWLGTSFGSQKKTEMIAERH